MFGDMGSMMLDLVVSVGIFALLRWAKSLRG